MSHWDEDLQTAVVAQLTPVSLDERAAILAGPAGAEHHRMHFDRLAALREIEAGGASARRDGVDGPARIAFWNVERLRHIDAITSTLKGVGADINVLCEVDRGMARTQNTDRIVDLAGRLDQAYLYAVEFVELGLGDVNEQAQHAGEDNAQGFHGAALLSDVEMATPFLIRLEGSGNWFDGSHNERRVGSTIAIGAKIRVAGQMVTVVNVHLESHCDPATRARHVEGMLARIETIAPGAPVILGGDFNTSTASPAQWLDRVNWLETIRQEPQRLTAPQAYEPLFDAARQYGYDWQDANVPDAPTRRFAPGSERPNHKLDWFFTRGLTASDPRIVPATYPDGSPSSDHECLTVMITPVAK